MAQKNQKNQSTSTSNPPVQEKRIGLVRVQVWQRDGQHGPMYSLTMDRLYKAQDGSWATTHSFGEDDALILAKAIDWAHSWIVHQKNEAAEARRAESQREGGGG